METTVNKTKLKCTVETMVIYRCYFGTEYLDEISDPETEQAAKIKFLWACAKTADPSIPRPAEWISVKTATYAAISAAERIFCESKTTMRKSETGGDGGRWDSAEIMAMAAICGISDIYNMTVGFALDVINAYCDIRSGDKKATVRRATQADFDNF